MRSKNAKIKSRKNMKIIFSCLLILFFLLILLIIFTFVRLFGNRVYKVESRWNDIKEEKKKDTKEIKTVGWIRVQGTNIDYPVVYAPKYDFGYKTDDFTWTEADYQKFNNIVFVSGHNILNQSSNPKITAEKHTRFEQLMSFTYYDFIKENQYIQYTFGGKDYVYKIYSVFYEKDTDLDLYNGSSYSDEEMNIFIDDALEKSIYNFEVDVNKDDHMIALVTCTKMFNDERDSFVVVGRLLRKGEEATLSEVEKSSKYKEVEKQMKGGEVYEES